MFVFNYTGSGLSGKYYYIESSEMGSCAVSMNLSSQLSKGIDAVDEWFEQDI